MPSKSKVKITKAAPVTLSWLEYALPLAGGAVAVMLVLSFLRFGALEVWQPFAIGGAKIFKGLAASALAGGITCAVLGRRFSGPMAATACALGWALWGWGLHFGAQGRYLEFLPGGLDGSKAAGLIFSNAISQSLAVAFALLLASAVSWFWVRRRKDSIFDPEPISDDDLAGQGLRSFGTAFVYPLSTAIGGVILLMIAGVLALPLGAPMGAPTTGQLPSGPGAALWCGVLTMVALGLATYGARRAFRALGSVGDVVVAPLVIAFVAGLFAAANGQMPILLPAALLIWRTSAFELASWGALGASAGYYFARAQLMQVKGV